MYKSIIGKKKNIIIYYNMLLERWRKNWSDWHIILKWLVGWKSY